MSVGSAILLKDVSGTITCLSTYPSFGVIIRSLKFIGE